MLTRAQLCKLGLMVAVTLGVATGCTNPSDDVGVDTLPDDAVDTITGDGGWFDSFLDAAPEVEDDAPCLPVCSGPGGVEKECGDDGCGGETCGKCAPGMECSADYLCVVPSHTPDIVAIEEAEPIDLPPAADGGCSVRHRAAAWPIPLALTGLVLLLLLGLRRRRVR